MMNGSVDVFNQKVSLIYEYNNKSPLFVKVAGIEIEKNNLDRAIKILLEGLKLYPDYPTAHFLLAKSYTLKSNYSQALSYLKSGSTIINSPKSFDHYLKEIESIKKRRTFFNISRWAEYAKENLASNQLPASANNISASKDETIEEALSKLTDDIEETRQSIKNAKEKIEETKETVGKDLIISETLAKIYANQNEIPAAISVYKKLIKKQPDKEEYYKSKIEELKNLT